MSVVLARWYETVIFVCKGNEKSDSQKKLAVFCYNTY